MSKALVFLCVIGIAVAPPPEKKPGGPINCLPDKVSCLDNECVFKSYWCDGFVDCGDRSDEGEHCKIRSYLGRFNNRKTKNVIQKSEAKSKYRNDLLDQLARLISKSRE